MLLPDEGYRIQRSTSKYPGRIAQTIHKVQSAENFIFMERLMKMEIVQMTSDVIPL